MDTSISTTSTDTAHIGCPPHAPADIRDVIIDTTLPVHNRIEQYIAHADDPYNIQIGKNAVHISYTDNAPPLSAILETIALATGSG